MANIIEVALEAKDSASAVVDRAAKSFFALGNDSAAASSKLAGLSSSVSGLKSIFAGVVAAFVGGSIFGKFISETEEAQNAAVKLDTIYKAVGSTVGVTRERLDQLADQMQRTTVYSDDLTREAEALLLTFDKVRGQAFEQTIAVAADVSSVLGTDLVGSVQQLGFAFQNLESGGRVFKRLGIQDDVIKMAKALDQAGESGKAQALILSDLSRKFAGAAEAAGGTLSGALRKLKNAFGDLFEASTDQTTGTVTAINELTQALNDPKIKSGLDAIINGLVTITTKAIEGASAIGRFIFGVAKTELQTTEDAIASIEKKLDDLEVKRTRAGSTRRVAGDEEVLSSSRAGVVTVAQAREALENLRKKREELKKAEEAKPLAVPSKEAADEAQLAAKRIVDGLQEVSVAAKKIEPDALQEVYRQWEEDTRTTVETMAADLEDGIEKINVLVRDGIITPEEGTKRKQDKLDEVLPEIDLNGIQAKYKTVEAATTETSEFIKGVWQGVGQSIQHTMSDALYNARFSLRGLIDIFRRALADISAAIITSGIKNLLVDQLSAGTGSGGLFGSLIGGIAGLFGGGGAVGGVGAGDAALTGVTSGFAAGGGRIDGPTTVGEDGPEVVVPEGSGARVFNERQLAFLGGGGGSMNYTPTWNIQIEGSRNDEQMKQELASFVVRQDEKTKADLMRLWQRNGYGGMR